MKLPTYDAQLRHPGVSGAVRGDPGAAAAGGQGLFRAGQGVQAFGAEWQAFDAQQTKARQVADLARLQADATAGLAELEFALDRDPDYRSAAQKFADGSTALKNRLAERAGDPVVRRMFETGFDKLAVAKGISVRQAAFRREADANVAQLDEQTAVYAHAIAGAKTEAERTFLLGQATAGIRGMAAAGWIGETDAGKRERGLYARIDEAAARNLITADPDAAAEAVASAERFPNLPEERRAVLVDMATRRAEAKARQTEIAEARAVRLREQQIRQASETASQDYIRRIFGDDATLRAQDIAADERLTSSDRLQMIRVLEQAQKPEPPAAVSRAALRDLAPRVHAPEGDPRRLTDLSEINAAFYEGRLTRADFDFLRKELADSRTGDGARLGQTKAAFLKGVERLIDKSNLLMGVADPEGGQKFYEFSHMVGRRIEAARKAGQDPHELFNPASDAYLGRPETLRPFQKTLADSLSDLQRRLQSGTPPAAGQPPAASRPALGGFFK